MAFMGDMMNPAPLWQNGPAPGAFYNFPANSSGFGPSTRPVQDFKAHSATPITTTTTVIGVKFDKGCVIAADTLGSYGTLARFRDCPRIMKVNDLILLVDKLGTAYEDAAIATGLGAYMATPLVREAVDKGNLDEEGAKALVRKCMEVLFYRDARAFQRYQLGVVTSAGVRIEDLADVKHDWSLAHMIHMK
ncbi:hypothetical protein HF086_006493 [Spodoptera exigua]|uniref:Proteasome subunit beta type-4 n=1 Tax=Spodoptera exigua TaxID=7107 RepID=A0A922MLL4_SPOEX|nr:hypothetical protein HF086_006493 [Spodoptera exigua]